MPEVGFRVLTPTNEAENAVVADYIYDFLRRPEIWPYLNEGAQRGSFIYMVIQQWLAGTRQLGVPTVDGDAAGLFWMVPMNTHLVEGFQAVRDEYRKYSFECLRLACDAAFTVNPSVKGIVGFIHEENKRSLVVARHTGFKKQGEINNYFTNNGETSKAIVMVKERYNV